MWIKFFLVKGAQYHLHELQTVAYQNCHKSKLSLRKLLFICCHQKSQFVQYILLLGIFPIYLLLRSLLLRLHYHSHLNHFLILFSSGASTKSSSSLNNTFESYQKTLKNGIHSFPAWRSAFRGGCGEQAGKFDCCVLGQGT